jgi:hypothetical protein
MMKTWAPPGDGCGCKALKVKERQGDDVLHIRKTTSWGQDVSCTW